MDDNDFKWWMIGMAAIAAVAFACCGYEAYTRSQTEQTAMEQGYIQTVDEDTGRVLWVKP